MNFRLATRLGAVSTAIVFGAGVQDTVAESAAKLCAPTNGQAERLAETSSARTLTFMWFDPHGLLGNARILFEAELRRILRCSKIELVWVTPEDLDQEEPVPRALVRATLFDYEPSRFGYHRGAMGVTNLSNDEHRSIMIFFPAITRTLQQGSTIGERSWAESRWGRKRLSKAIARVVVHELVHIVAPGYPHTPDGLMSARLSAKELMDPDSRLDPVSTDALLSGLECRKRRTCKGRGVGSRRRCSAAPFGPFVRTPLLEKSGVARDNANLRMRVVY